MRERGAAWLLLHFLVFLFSLFSLFAKFAAGHELLSPPWFVFYGLALLMLGFYAIGWQQVMKRLPLSSAYANKAAAVLWGQLWGLLFFGERLSPGRVAGALLIVAGIILYARSSGEAA